jgi:molybdopterin/thiamine biosynthesis adenylyltransferase
VGKEHSLALLSSGQMPERYIRNAGTVGIIGQEKLLKARVLIIGAGGLGGTVVELLARMGVGYLRIVDGDTFAPHNLNRQLLSNEKNLGKEKSLTAIDRVADINSDVEVEAINQMLNADNAEQLLTGMDIVVDALDNINDRLLLQETAAKIGIPMVHAAIAGFTGHIMTIFPGDPGLKQIYKDPANYNKGIEIKLGNPAATPGIAAALEVQEVVKLITGLGEPLRNRLFYFDTEYNSFQIIQFS